MGIVSQVEVFCDEPGCNNVTKVTLTETINSSYPSFDGRDIKKQLEKENWIMVTTSKGFIAEFEYICPDHDEDEEEFSEDKGNEPE